MISIGYVELDSVEMVNRALGVGDLLQRDALYADLRL